MNPVVSTTISEKAFIPQYLFITFKRCQIPVEQRCNVCPVLPWSNNLQFRSRVIDKILVNLPNYFSCAHKKTQLSEGIMLDNITASQFPLIYQTLTGDESGLKTKSPLNTMNE